jgi:RNA polymerase sigma-70 factor (ECF subfamily)
MSSMLELPPVVEAVHDGLPAALPAQPQPQLRLVPDVPDVPLDFDDAVRRITPRLQRYARRRLGDAHEAEELVQEALLRAYKHGDQLRTEDDLTAWCTVVTGRLVIDRLRVRGRSTSVAEVPEGTRVGRDTAEVVVARDEARMALDALDAMPARQAAVLWAREVEGQGYDEIGERFGMTEPAVRSILTRARKALRKEYAMRGGTLPVGGLAVLAPWVRGLRWADKVRAAATKLAAPAAIGAMALGLVGGALHSPIFGSVRPPATSQAVVATPSAATTLNRSDSVAIRPTTVAAQTQRSVSVGRSKPVSPTLTERHLQRACVGAAGAGAGSGGCAPVDNRGSHLFVNATLPENPTGVRDLGLYSNKVDCSFVPNNPAATCTPAADPSTGGTR